MFVRSGIIIMIKKLKPLIAILIFAFTTSSSFAQSNVEKDDMNTVEHYTQVVDNYLRGLHEKDPSRILSLFAEIATVEDPVGSELVEGMKALKKFYGGAVTMDLKL